MPLPPRSPDRSYWQQRWFALNDVITTVEVHILDGQTTLRPRLMRLLLRQLASFGEKQFYFLYDGLRAAGAAHERFPGRLESLAAIPQTSPYAKYRLDYDASGYILRATLSKIATDLAAIKQRREQQFTSEVLARRKLIESWSIGDLLAFDALRRLAGTDQEQATVYTYLDRSPRIRIIPYAPVAFVGLPFTCVGAQRDFVVIPHEVAHYHYWKSKSNGKFWREVVEEVFQAVGLPDDSPIRPWGEEIFADVVGCLIGGPVVALAMQDAMLEVIDKPFVTYNETYPTPCLRPFIHLATLEKLNQQGAAYQKLAQQWAAVWEDRNVADSHELQNTEPQADTAWPLPRLAFEPPPIRQLGTVKEQLYLVVHELVERLPASLTDPWVADLTAGQELDDLYRTFDAVVDAKRQELAAAPDFGSPDPDESTLQTWQSLFSWDRFVEELGYDSSAATTGHQIWLEIFEADGWTTEGPGPGNVH